MHYLLQSGHNQQHVFADDGDRQTYLAMLRAVATQYRVAIHAYAVLDAEVHLLATPTGPDSLSRLMQSLGRRYVSEFNRRHARSGTLWQGRFRAALIDGESLGHAAILHIESQAVAAGLVGAASEWSWSSAAHHLGRCRDPLISEHLSYWSLGNTPFEREHAHALKLLEGVSPSIAGTIELAVSQGRPAGSAAFLRRLEERTGRALATRRRGRPPGPSR